MVASHFAGAALTKDGKIALSESIPMGEGMADYVYELCSFENGIIENNDGFFNGESIEEAEYQQYCDNGIKLEGSSDSDNVVQTAYENMIIWE